MTHSGPCWHDHAVRAAEMGEIADLIIGHVQRKGASLVSRSLLLGQLRTVEYLIEGIVCGSCRLYIEELTRRTPDVPATSTMEVT